MLKGQKLLSSTGTNRIKKPNHKPDKPRRIVWWCIFILAVSSLSATAFMPKLNRLLFSELVYIDEPDRVDSIYVFCGYLEEYLWRVEAAGIAFRKFAAKEIILFDDGVIGPWSPGIPSNPTSVQRAERKLIDMGIPPGRIIILEGVIQRTMDEAMALKNYLADQDLTSLLLVTSPYHLRRAYWSVSQVLASSSSIRVYTFTFNVEDHPKLLKTRLLTFEYIKLLLYRIRYG